MKTRKLSWQKRVFLDANMSSAFYPTKARYFIAFQTAFRKWLRAPGFPPSLDQHIEPFLQHQWRLRVAHLKQQPRFTARLLRQLQQFLGAKVVLHHADHELQQLRVFCPQQYFKGALNTWQAPELFQPLPHLTYTTPRTTSLLRSPLPFDPVTSGGSEKTSQSPTALSHLQATSSASLAEPLTSSSNAFSLSIRASFPSHNYGTTSTHISPTLLPTLPSAPPIFFNPVPQHRLIDAVHSLVQERQTQHSTHTLTVDTQASPSRNQYRFQPRWKFREKQ